MKWKNKGHENDLIYQAIEKKKNYYLFGAGDYGNQFLRAVGRGLDIIAYIDNNREKQGKTYNEYPCISLDSAICNEETGIVITMSQIARVEPIEQLKRNGLKEDVDFFVIEKFLSIYMLYKYDKVYFSSISFLPSTACNLNCKNCLNFNPFAKQFYVREWEDLKKDVDLFFSCVDHIMLFHVSGGEPMVYKYTADLLEYIDQNYGDKIDTLRTVTNGTIVPKDEVLEKLSNCNIEITVDDYRDAVPKFREKFDLLIRKLELYGIRYYINKVDNWIDLAPEKTDYSAWSDSQLEAHRNACNQSWQELRDGKLYSCNYAAYATVAGIVGEQDVEETFDLRDYIEKVKQNSLAKKELVEFRLGYTTKGYTNFCKKCRGFTPENREEVRPAIQLLSYKV